jgi:hypothetical protein
MLRGASRREEPLTFEEVIVGFDVRVRFDRPAEHWDEERRDSYLLRPEVPVPLSVDEAVWPRPGSSLAEGRFEVLTPRYSSLEDALAAATSDEVVVAISQWRGPGEPELPAGPTWPMKVDPAWERLGWDVVDGVFPSGISNCQFRPEEVLQWRDGWAERFNGHHLFDELPVAFAWRDQCAKRVPEHAPFSVMGLYLVRAPAPVG